jgi:hypothetical protein
VGRSGPQGRHHPALASSLENKDRSCAADLSAFARVLKRPSSTAPAGSRTHHGVELRHLRYVVALASELNLRRAAAAHQQAAAQPADSSDRGGTRLRRRRDRGHWAETSQHRP